MEDPSVNRRDLTSELAVPLYAFALGSVVLGIDPRLVAAGVLWWDGRISADPPRCVAASWLAALALPLGSIAVGISLVRRARHFRHPWYAWGGFVVSIGALVHDLAMGDGPIGTPLATSVAGGAIAGVAAGRVASLLESISGFVADSPVRWLVVRSASNRSLRPPDDGGFL